jgi:hypothetical protein
MGWVAAFIPTPVMRGFIEGLAQLAQNRLSVPFKSMA